MTEEEYKKNRDQYDAVDRFENYIKSRTISKGNIGSFRHGVWISKKIDYLFETDDNGLVCNGDSFFFVKDGGIQIECFNFEAMYDFHKSLGILYDLYKNIKKPGYKYFLHFENACAYTNYNFSKIDLEKLKAK